MKMMMLSRASNFLSKRCFTSLSTPRLAYIFSGEAQDRDLGVVDRIANDLRDSIEKGTLGRYDHQTIYKLMRQAKTIHDFKAILYVFNLFLNHGRSFDHQDVTTKLYYLAEHCGEKEDAHRLLFHYNKFLKHAPNVSIFEKTQRIALQENRPGDAFAILKQAREDWQVPLSCSMYEAMLEYILQSSSADVNPDVILSECSSLIFDAHKVGVRLREDIICSHIENLLHLTPSENQKSVEFSSELDQLVSILADSISPDQFGVASLSPRVLFVLLSLLSSSPSLTANVANRFGTNVVALVKGMDDAKLLQFAASWEGEHGAVLHGGLLDRWLSKHSSTSAEQWKVFLTKQYLSRSQQSSD
eukprot:GDKJ01034693.1.p1 GENE.GDKJ01034693.1~~GDKJ01034693.1.p1  ORF type:complete len:365 (-),score=81.32 GDKJ01034693.1:76-1149(-)